MFAMVMDAALACAVDDASHFATDVSELCRSQCLNWDLFRSARVRAGKRSGGGRSTGMAP